MDGEFICNSNNSNKNNYIYTFINTGKSKINHSPGKFGLVHVKMKAEIYLYSTIMPLIIILLLSYYLLGEACVISGHKKTLRKL